MTFGETPASYMATRLKRLAEEKIDSFPSAKCALLNDFYDDDVSGAQSLIMTQLNYER